MKSIRSSAIGILIVLAGTLALAGPAFGASHKTPFQVYEVACLVAPGTQWVAGQTVHLRGRMSQHIFYDAVSFEIAGENSVVGSFNMNLATGESSWFGTFSGIYLPESDTGTFEGTWHGRLTPDDGFLGRARGRGTGDLTGKRMKLQYRSLDPSELPLEMLIILSQAPWTECEEIAGIFLDTGFIHSPGGN